MAPVITEFVDDCIDMEFTLDEITSLATLENPFANNKLVMGNELLGISQALQPPSPVPQPMSQEAFIHPASSELVALQPASPVPQPLLVSQEAFIHPASPEFVTLQPASPVPQPMSQDAFIHPASPEFVTLQPASSEGFLQQPLSPSVVPQQAQSPKPCIIQVQPASPVPQPEGYLSPPVTPPASSTFLVLQPASTEPLHQSPSPSPVSEVDSSPISFNILELSVNSEELDALQLPTSFECQTDSILSPMSVLQQEEAASPAPQQVPSPTPQQATKIPKKRGRKPKYPDGNAPSRRRPRKTKLYEMGPLLDEEMEKKRKFALNAKKHRDMQKEQKKMLSSELELARAERDQLLELLNQYKKREQQLLEMLTVNGIMINELNHTFES